MQDAIRFAPTWIGAGQRREDAWLVFAGDRLLGVLSKLSGAFYGQADGKLHLEADLCGLSDPPHSLIFEDLSAATARFEAHMAAGR